jgi:plastocyanin
MTFTPSNLTVTSGTTVTWDFLSGTHNVTSGTAPTADGAYTSGTPQTSGTFTHQFNTTGTFHYFCSVHGTMMTGTITVN